MKITLDVNINLPYEVINFFKNLALQTLQTEDKQSTFEIPTKPTSPTKDITKPKTPTLSQSPKEESIESTTSQVNQSITLDMIRPVFAEKMKIGKRKEIKQILNDLGVDKLSDIPTDKYEVALKMVNEV